MIGFISGKVEGIGDKDVIVNTDGGIGYIVSTTKTQREKIVKKKSVELYTHLVVRDNAMELVGFIDKESLNMFKLLISVSHIGPKTALNILNEVPVEELIIAVASEDTETLTKGYGIGKKSAERLILELKGKVDAENKEKGVSADVITALLALGYGKEDSRNAIKGIKDKNASIDIQIREALSILSNI